MSSKFNFSQHCVHDIDDIAYSFHPFSIRSGCSSPTTSLSPHTYAPSQLTASTLTISIDTAPNNNEDTETQKQTAPITKRIKSKDSLQIPSDSECHSIHSSPLLSEPSPKAASPLTLNPVLSTESTTTPPLQIQTGETEQIYPLYPSYYHQSIASPVSTTSTCDLTPLYTAHILDNQGIPDLCLPAPLCDLTPVNSNCVQQQQSDSDYDFESDLILNQQQLHIDNEFETKLLSMGSLCCSEYAQQPKKGKVEFLDTPNSSAHALTMGNKVLSGSATTEMTKQQSLQIIVNNDTNSTQKQQQELDDEVPPIPNDHTEDDLMLDTKSFQSIEEREDDEQKDVVSPIDFNSPRLDYNKSATNHKRPSASALSSPLHSVRLSITPKVNLHLCTHNRNLVCVFV